MKLNEEGKIKLRRLIEEQLVNVPDGQRIHLDKKLLEELLFEKIVYKNETGEFLKLPIWSGPFLRKIDLSEVSFDNVSWALRGVPDYFLIESFDQDVNWGFMDKDILDKLMGYILPEPENYYQSYNLPEIDLIDYSFTNANINFDTSFEALSLKKEEGVLIYRCNFSGVDLSKNKFSSRMFFDHVDLSYSGINIDNYDNLYRKGSYFQFCNFEGNDFSNISLPSIFFSKEGDINAHFDHCDFRKTGLNIIYIEEPSKEFPYRNVCPHYFAELLNDGFFDGCYIDGNKVLPSFLRPKYSENLKENPEHIRQFVYSSIETAKDEEYSNFEEELFGSIINNIEEQKKSFRR